MATPKLVDGVIAGLSQGMKQVRSFSGDNPLKGQAAKGLLERFPFAFIQSVMCGNELRHPLCELPQLDDGCWRIVRKVALCKRPEPQKLFIVFSQKAKI